MQLPGPGVFGPPEDRDLALVILRRAVDAGVNHIDTAQFYGPDVANELIHQALHPYPDDLVLVSKVGAARSGTGEWLAAQQPAELLAGIQANLASLGLDQIPVVNLRRHPESDVPFAEQLDAMIAMREEGLIGSIGLSNVSLEQYRVARGRIHPENPVLGAPAVKEMARRLEVMPAQVALAWLLYQAPTVLLIPGTSSLEHLGENLGAGNLVLDQVALEVLTG